MRRLGLIAELALTAVILFGMCAPMRATAPVRVAVRVLTSAGVDEHLVAAMFQELVSTWRRTGVDVVLYSKGLDPRPVTTVSLMVSSEWPSAALAGSLGWMRLVTDPDLERGAVPIPILMVSIAATGAVVDAAEYRGGPIFQRPLELRRDLLARALGRVAAHELGHYLLASAQHTPYGLMRARFHPQELVGDDGSTFCVHAAERRRLEARLRDAQLLQAKKLE
jgi:hypothetical protein